MIMRYRIILFSVLGILLFACKKEITRSGKTLYDGCPECEGDEYVTATKKWSKSAISFAFRGTVSAERKNTIEQALRLWESVIPLNFSLTGDPANADIVISFERGDHGDGIVFDGAADPDGNLLAHGFFPPPTRGELAGDLHFDFDEQWTNELRDNNDQPIDLFTVALHELGHCLGLRHSTVPESIMYPEYKSSKRELDQDDIDGIQSVYGARSGNPVTTSSLMYSSGTLAGISNAVVFNNSIHTVAGFEPALNSVVGYPDPATWYKTSLVNDNARVYPVSSTSTSASVFDYDLSVTADNQLAVVYQYPTGTQYGFVLPVKKFNGTSFVSTDNVFTNNNWGINPQILYDNSNNPHVISWAAAGYALLYHQKNGSAWQTAALTSYSNIVVNLKSILNGNKILLSARHNLYNTNNQNQTLRLYSKDLNSNSWSVITTSLAIDNNCDLLADRQNQVYHLVYKGDELLFGQLNNLKKVVNLPGIDNRATAIFDDSNTPYIAIQTAAKVIVYKQTGNSWSTVFDENIIISPEALSRTSISLVKLNGQYFVVFADQNSVRKKQVG